VFGAFPLLPPPLLFLSLFFTPPPPLFSFSGSSSIWSLKAQSCDGGVTAMLHFPPSEFFYIRDGPFCSFELPPPLSFFSKLFFFSPPLSKFPPENHEPYFIIPGLCLIFPSFSAALQPSVFLFFFFPPKAGVTFSNSAYPRLERTRPPAFFYPVASPWSATSRRTSVVHLQGCPSLSPKILQSGSFEILYTLLRPPVLHTPLLSERMFSLTISCYDPVCPPD